MTDLGRKKLEVLREISKEYRPQIQEFYLNLDDDPEGPLGYQALITQMRTLFREKDHQRAAHVLHPHNLGGHMPSQFLAILKHEMSGITLDMIVKEILAGVLPPSIWAIVTTDTNSVTEMAEAADSFSS